MTPAYFNNLQKVHPLSLRLVKKIITIFFLFIISIQCLPVKELGKSLFDNTISEEELCEKGIDKKQLPDNCKEFYLDHTALPANAFHNIKRFFKIDTDLFAAPPADVSTPPPNA